MTTSVDALAHVNEMEEKMTAYEIKAYECGKTYFPETKEKLAPCYDDRMKSLVCEARSLQGRLYNYRNIRAWWCGALENFPEAQDFIDRIEEGMNILKQGGK